MSLVSALSSSTNPSVGNRAVEGSFLRIFNFSPDFAPSGKTVVQVEFETEWDFWDQLQKEDRPRYDAEKERVAAEVLERLEAQYPGISSQVEATDVTTPYTTWRYTRNHRGAFEGWLLTPETINARVEKTLPGTGEFLHGRPVGGAEGRHSAVYLLGPTRGADPVSQGPEAVFDKRTLEHL